MKPPRETAGRDGQAGGPADTVPEQGDTGAAPFSLPLTTPLKPPEPLGYSQTSSQTAKNSRSFVEPVLLDNPPITPGATPTHPGSAGSEAGKPAPSAPKPLSLPPLLYLRPPSSAGGYRRVPGSTPPRTAFTPSPAVEYVNLCRYHASLDAYLERERPHMLSQGDGAGLAELDRLAGAMLDRLSELEAQGAHRTGSP